MKVLIVDDSRMYLSMLDAYVQDIGHETILASCGEQAIALYHEKQPDLVLLDVTMPDMDGYEVAKQLRACKRRVWVPIIFLSGLIEDKDVLRGIEAGGDDYVTKPASQIMIQAKVQAMQRIAEMSHVLIKTSEQLQQANQKLHDLSLKDGLTGIANRRCFDKTLHQEWKRAMRHQAPLTLMMVDIDYFKPYNDRYGHQQGDTCLIQVAQCMQKALQRSSDVVARYGGEEFAIIMPEVKRDAIAMMGERMCAAVQALRVPHEGSQTSEYVSISVGIAKRFPQRGEDEESLIQAADQALYQAKDMGRNRVVIAEESPN